METAAIFEKITPIFREVFDDNSLVPTPAMTAKDVEEWDSLNHIRLIVSIETAFGIKFAVTEIAGLKNVGDLVALIRAKL